MKLKTGVAIFLGLLFAGSVQADKLRIATEGDNPPFNMKNDKGNLIGFEVDIARALCYQMKADCEIVEQKKDAIIPALLDGKIDAVIASLAITAELQKQVAFSRPYYSNYLQLIGKKGGEVSVSMAGIQDKKVGARRSSQSAQYLQDSNVNSALIKLYDTNDGAFQDLKSGLLDAVLVSAYEGYNWLIQAENSDFDILGEQIDVKDRTAIAIRKDDQALKEKLDRALNTIMANGTYKRINWNYFPYDVF